MRPDRDALEIRFPRVQGYRVELPGQRLPHPRFAEDSLLTLTLTPELVGATETRNSGIIGKTVDLNLAHTGDVRPSQVVYELSSHLLLSKWRDANAWCQQPRYAWPLGICGVHRGVPDADRLCEEG